ncbi:hypothetical protein [Clostridium sp. FP1]|uniref:hypothetical protein n=1 Tax=Clostridium sp. FP1 TaxID=2724076 RepID=UPI0013E9135C|nr:hypothetical protein [Clostridium sp. FP1]MBZ9635487.1 hypothetical protein [Clostridium sp. FP1]
MAGEIFIADKATLDSVKADTNALKASLAIVNADTDDLQTNMASVKTTVVSTNSNETAHYNSVTAQIATVKTDTATLKANASTIITNIADVKSETSLIKADTTNIKGDISILKADTIALKASTGIGSIYSDNFETQQSDQSNLVVNLLGKYELLSLCNYDTTTAGSISIRIDGATNRKKILIAMNAVTNLSGMGIRCSSSMSVYSSYPKITCTYRTLP